MIFNFFLAFFCFTVEQGLNGGYWVIVWWVMIFFFQSLFYYWWFFFINSICLVEYIDQALSTVWDFPSSSKNLIAPTFFLVLGRFDLVYTLQGEWDRVILLSWLNVAWKKEGEKGKKEKNLYDREKKFPCKGSGNWKWIKSELEIICKSWRYI